MRMQYRTTPQKRIYLAIDNPVDVSVIQRKTGSHPKPPVVKELDESTVSQIKDVVEDVSGFTAEKIKIIQNN